MNQISDHHEVVIRLPHKVTLFKLGVNCKVGVKINPEKGGFA